MGKRRGTVRVRRGCPASGGGKHVFDTTFRDGQQARPPYTVKQIARIYDLLHKLGGKSGLIQASEFFMYSPKDRKEMCIRDRSGLASALKVRVICACPEESLVEDMYSR